MYKNKEDRWEYDKEEFTAMSEAERDSLMDYLADQLNGFADNAREVYALADWMCKMI